MVEFLKGGDHRGGAFLSPTGLGEGHEVLLGKVELVLDDARSGCPDIRRSVENVDQSNVWVAQTRIFGICSKVTTKLGLVIERGLEYLIEGDRHALWKGDDTGDESLCFWSLRHITDVGALEGTKAGRDLRIYKSELPL